VRALVKPLQDEIKAQGLWAIFLDEELGGPGYGQLKLGLLNEILGRYPSAPQMFGAAAPDTGNMEMLAAYGTEEQKERWLTPMLNQELWSAYSMTEPQGGSDPNLFRTHAVRDGDEWVINGEKWFTSAGRVADILFVMCTNGMFVVPRTTPGVEIMPEPRNHNHVIYNEVRVPLDHLLGPEDGAKVLAQRRLGGGRIHHAMRWLGQAQRSLDIMCERAVSRSSHGKLLAQHQMIQDYVATSHMEIQAARLLTFQTAWRMDQYGASTIRAELGMIKAHVSKVVLAVLDRTIQVCGALGYSTDLPVEGWYRGTRFGPIGDGPDELHKSVLARTLLKGYTPVEGWPTEHIPSRRPAAEEKWATLRVAAGIT